MRFIVIPDEVFSSRLTEGAQRLYGLIYSIHRSKRKPVVSENIWFAQRLNKDIRTIERRLHELKEAGYITIYYKRFHKTSVRREILPILRHDISVR